MKLASRSKIGSTSVFLSLLLPLKAFPLEAIILSYSNEDSSKAKWIKKVITNKYHIPQLLIKDDLKENGFTCIPNRDSALHLCIDHNKELRIKHVDNEIISESFSIFN